MSDARLHARAKGDGGAAVVLLHGFGGDHGEWVDIQPDLARDHRTLAYDLPGHGRSLDVAGAGSAGAAAKAVLTDLTARGIDRVHVVGFSMGGAVATLMALRAPGRIASLTLLAPGGFGPEINSDLLERFAASATADELRATLDEMAGPDFRLPTRNVAGLAAVRFAPGMRDSMMRIVGSIARDGRQGEIPRASLESLAMPVTLVWGTADPVLPFAHTDNLPARFALHPIPGAGHMLPVEALKTVISLIRRTVRSAG